MVELRHHFKEYWNQTMEVNKKLLTFEVFYFILSLMHSNLKITGPYKSHLPRTSSSIDGSELSSARKISMSTAEMETPSHANTDHLHTVLVMQMGQFIDHDITHASQHTKLCCGENNLCKHNVKIIMILNCIVFAHAYVYNYHLCSF